MTKADRVRTITVATYPCRVCGHTEVRRFFSLKDYDQDIIAQNHLCMRCYLDGKFEPGNLVPPSGDGISTAPASQGRAPISPHRGS